MHGLATRVCGVCTLQKAYNIFVVIYFENLLLQIFYFFFDHELLQALRPEEADLDRRFISSK